MALDLSLLLRNAFCALANNQMEHGMFLLQYAITLADHTSSSLAFSSLDAAIGLDQGLLRETNEDCVLALQGTLPETQEAFGLFAICDGMGGHVSGLEAAHLAIQTLVESISPHLLGGSVPGNDWARVLVESVEQANRAIYLRNHSLQRGHDMSMGTGQTGLMGTTMTATLLLSDIAYIVNVGDSRAYLYTPAAGLTRVTRDHSVVATLLADKIIEEEEIYTHPKRNQITRAVGVDAAVEVDTFVLPLQEQAILLLCSDGLWEMTRDPRIEEILSFDWASAEYMANRLVRLANEGGGRDNIGLLVVQVNGRQRRSDISNMATINHPVDALTRLVPLSSYASSPSTR